MKKIILVLICMFVITGCGSNEQTNVDMVNEISKIETNEGIKEFEGLMVLDNNTIETEIGLTTDDVESYTIQVPEYLDSRLYIVVKPKSDKEERVKNQIEIYISTLKNRIDMELESNTELIEEEKTTLKKKQEMLNNMTKEEYKGYLIYISSSNNDKILETIKNNI